MVNTHPSIDALVAELVRQNHLKADYRPSTSQISMTHVKPKMDLLQLSGVKGGFGMESLFHQQLSTYLDIPKRYYDSIEAVSDLRALTVNKLMEQKNEKRTVRTLDGNARAFLSDRFKFIDHLFVLTPFIGALEKLSKKKEGEFTVTVSALAQRRLHVQIRFDNMIAKVKSPAFPKGEIVHYGVTLLNSEVGLGAYDIRSYLWWMWCKNGAIAESLIRKYHVGKSEGDDEEADDFLILSDKTIALEMKAIQAKTYDILMNALSADTFKKHIELIEESVEDGIDKPVAVVENITKRFPLFSVSEGEELLAKLTKGKNMNRYGLGNAITRLAQEVPDPDRGYEMERVGYDVLSMTKRGWEGLVKGSEN